MVHEAQRNLEPGRERSGVRTAETGMPNWTTGCGKDHTVCSDGVGLFAALL